MLAEVFYVHGLTAVSRSNSSAAIKAAMGGGYTDIAGVINRASLKMHFFRDSGLQVFAPVKPVFSPSMDISSVPIKTTEQQDVQNIHCQRERIKK